MCTHALKDGTDGSFTSYPGKARVEGWSETSLEEGLKIFLSGWASVINHYS